MGALDTQSHMATLNGGIKTTDSPLVDLGWTMSGAVDWRTRPNRGQSSPHVRSCYMFEQTPSNS